MTERHPIPRQPDLLVVSTETTAALLRLEEDSARFLAPVPLKGPLAPDLLEHVLLRYARPETYARIFVIGQVEVHRQAIPVIPLPWDAIRSASRALEAVRNEPYRV